MPLDGPTPESQNPPLQANPAADADTIRAEVLNNVFGGKYKSEEDAKAGFWNLNNYASQAYQALSERVNPAALADARAMDPFAQLEQDSLVKGDVLRSAIRAEAQKLVREELLPMQQAMQARQTLALEAPDYLANEPAILTWLQKNPQVAAKVTRQANAGLHDLAAETALTYWRAANPPAHQGNAEQKAQAAIMGANMQPGRQLDQAQNRQEVLAQAIQYGHQSGDRRAAYSQVFPGFQVELPPHLADQFQR
jgi:hypothetical protein